MDFNGIRLTDFDQHGGATEYFYANGQKIAMTQPYEHRLHTHGVMNGTGNELNFGVDVRIMRMAATIRCRRATCFAFGSTTRAAVAVRWVVRGCFTRTGR